MAPEISFFSLLGRLVKRPSRRARLKERAAEYVRDVLVPAMGLPESGPRVEPLGTSRNTFVRVVSGPATEKLVVRFFPFVVEKRKGREHAHLSRLLKNLGLPVPEFRFEDCSEETVRRFGFEVVVEAFVEGSPCRGEDLRRPEVTDQTAGLLSLLHSCESDVSGKPWRPDDEEARLARCYRSRIRSWLEDIKDRSGGTIDVPDRREFSALEDRMDPLLEWIKNQRSFELVHGDLQRHNLLLDAQGQVTLVDFGATRFSFFEQDLIVARNSLFSLSPDTWEAFLEAYFRRSGEGKRTRFAETERDFSAYYHLERAASAARKIDKIRRGRRRPCRLEQFVDRMKHHWEEFLETF